MSTPFKQFSLIPADNRRLADLCGHCDENLRHLEKKLSVTIYNRGNQFRITGEEPNIVLAGSLLTKLYAEIQPDQVPLTPARLHLLLKETADTEEHPVEQTTNYSLKDIPPELIVPTKNGSVKPRTKNQIEYMQNILNHDINFALGPAGTGKTYLAVACAVDALEKNKVQRLILVRPAVEAGERLGFLPGDLSQKVDPYLRPLYDALFEMLGTEKVAKLLERNTIEIAPLAYMRGRTLNDSFIILDESQNTTREQMKMFLTRIGFGSKTVITGDLSQIDLPKGVQSGLHHAKSVLANVPGIIFNTFHAKDVMRHPLVQAIVRAYDAHES